MMGLWTDAWFYIPLVGLLVSGVLFFFLLGQYRLASEAADAGELDKEGDAVSAVAISPVYSPSDSAPAAKVKAADHEPKSEPESKTPDYSGPDRRKDPANTTGGISPAVVYMQNIKSELTDLHEDVRKLSKRVDAELDAVSTRDESLIERLAELTRAVESLKAAAAVPAPAPAAEPAPAPAPAPKKEKAPKKEPVKVETAPAAVVDDLAGLVAPAPAAEPKPEPKPEPAQTIELKAEPAPAPKTETVSPDATIRLELGSATGVPKSAEPEKVTDAVAEPAPEEKPRRGPVWPV